MPPNRIIVNIFGVIIGMEEYIRHLMKAHSIIIGSMVHKHTTVSDMALETPEEAAKIFSTNCGVNSLVCLELMADINDRLPEKSVDFLAEGFVNRISYDRKNGNPGHAYTYLMYHNVLYVFEASEGTLGLGYRKYTNARQKQEFIDRLIQNRMGRDAIFTRIVIPFDIESNPLRRAITIRTNIKCQNPKYSTLHDEVEQYVKLDLEYRMRAR